MQELIWTIVIATLVFLPLELVLPARRAGWGGWQRIRTDLLHVFVGGMAIRFGTALLAVALLFPFRIETAIDLPLWLQVPAVLVLCDLMFWLAHRLFHAVPVLWRFHAIHHCSEKLDFLAAFRVHPVDQIVNSTIIAAPVVLLGFSPEALAIYAVAYKWHALLLHSNVRLSLGPLDALIATPAFHHWHHADQPDAYDRNFGGQLLIWDRLFGTLNWRGGTFPETYGIEENLPENYISHMVAPFVPSKEPAYEDATAPLR
ncbi:sterol desaturase family protein [Novosphingobium mangrovi (ex Huang et al. 2023)]|uniref:Sterol desaturase family protein n=1 Tax=Novosphingobium mangrovi (ex Huang et al. 2023) TaxID=2976432 RepID=A0ABT2I759_9SPHN|nr:sterol desaturase family protein [Novosphingobium mangrovi (ex Huang et al. 2023)]MCT2400650.1 sterol desaturase family protein [Novosphingobium mangrovi (ex Huang et al. 2023)]